MRSRGRRAPGKLLYPQQAGERNQEETAKAALVAVFRHGSRFGARAAAIPPFRAGRSLATPEQEFGGIARSLVGHFRIGVPQELAPARDQAFKPRSRQRGSSRLRAARGSVAGHGAPGGRRAGVRGASVRSLARVQDLRERRYKATCSGRAFVFGRLPDQFVERRREGNHMIRPASHRPGGPGPMPLRRSAKVLSPGSRHDRSPVSMATSNSSAGLVRHCAAAWEPSQAHMADLVPPIPCPTSSRMHFLPHPGCMQGGSHLRCGRRASSRPGWPRHSVSGGWPTPQDGGCCIARAGRGHRGWGTGRRAARLLAPSRGGESPAGGRCRPE